MSSLAAMNQMELMSGSSDAPGTTVCHLIENRLQALGPALQQSNSNKTLLLRALYPLKGKTVSKMIKDHKEIFDQTIDDLLYFSENDFHVEGFYLKLVEGFFGLKFIYLSGVLQSFIKGAVSFDEFIHESGHTSEFLTYLDTKYGDVRFSFKFKTIEMYDKKIIFVYPYNFTSLYEINVSELE